MAKKPHSFTPKDRVEHSVYGPGTVEEVNERHTTVTFDEAGTRKFVTEMIRLTASETPAPARPRRAKKKVARKPPK